MANGNPSSVIVQFFGICTHFERQWLPPGQQADWMQRVVLVNAGNATAFDHHQKLRDHHVAPHIALLQLRISDLVDPPHPLPSPAWFPIDYQDSSVVQWKLDGVTLRIGNASNAAAGPEAGILPSLSDYCAPPIHPLGPAAYEYVKERTACFFDFPVAPIEARIYAQGAVVTRVLVTTSANPTIEVTSFDGQTLSIPIRPEAQITVSNVPEFDTSDKDPDFLLHFLTLAEFPDTASYPKTPFTGTELHTDNPPRNTEGLSGPGCSSSGFP